MRGAGSGVSPGSLPLPASPAPGEAGRSLPSGGLGRPLPPDSGTPSATAPLVSGRCPGHGPFSCPHTSQTLAPHEALKPQVPLDTAFLPLLPGGSFAPSPSQDHPQLGVVKTPPPPVAVLVCFGGSQSWLLVARRPLWTAPSGDPRAVPAASALGGRGQAGLRWSAWEPGPAGPRAALTPPQARSEAHALAPARGRGAAQPAYLLPRPQPLIVLVLLRRGFAARRDV